jgi:hypothetical protein
MQQHADNDPKQVAGRAIKMMSNVWPAHQQDGRSLVWGCALPQKKVTATGSN